MSADVRSIAALRDWQADLTSYGENLAEAVVGVDLEIRRGFEWLNEQLALWRGAVRECEEDVTRAKAELAARKIPGWDDRDPDTTVQEKALRKARARLEHAEDQVDKIRKWIGRLPKLIDEVYTGPSQRLKSFLEIDLPKGLAILDRRVSSLESYAGLRPDYAPGPSSAPTPGADTPDPGKPETPP